jgi:hypothetical protein
MGQSDPAPHQNTGSRRMPLTIFLAASQLFSIRLPELPAAAIHKFTFTFWEDKQ